MERLNIYKTHSDIKLPEFMTKQSACFDLAFNPSGKQFYTGFNSVNVPVSRQFHLNDKIMIMPGERILVPTGLIFDIPVGFSVRLHSRSGLSLKKGLILANAEGVIDSDYVDEVMVMLVNTATIKQEINVGDRIAQAEMVVQSTYALWEITEAPKQKTDRVGGLGSTGVETVVSPSTSTGLNSVDLEPVKRGRGRPKKV